MIEGLAPRQDPAGAARDRHEPPPERGDRFARLLRAPGDAESSSPLQLSMDNQAHGVLAVDSQRSGTAAHVFNENGFFGSATPMPGEATGARASVASADAAPDGAASADPSVPSFVAMRVALVNAPVAAGTAATGTAPVSGPGVVPGPLPPAGAAVLGATPMAEQPDEGDAVPVARPRSAGARVRATAARSAVALALHEIENGLHVAARLEALDAADRSRLRDGIAALLARHGLAARSIQINAPARREPGEQGEYR